MNIYSIINISQWNIFLNKFCSMFVFLIMDVYYSGTQLRIMTIDFIC